VTAPGDLVTGTTGLDTVQGCPSCGLPG
jgi:hypothetical protein